MPGAPPPSGQAPSDTESRTLANAPPAPVYATGAPPRLAMTVDLAAGFDLAGVQSLHHAVDIRGRGSDCTIAS